MYIHSVKLVNYKSIGDYDEAEVILEPTVTAIVGKNESGKSNVLDGLSQIDFIGNKATAYAPEKLNRTASDGSQIRYIITIKPSSTDVVLNDTTIILSRDNYELTGGFLEYYHNAVKGNVDTLNEIIESFGGNPFKLRDQELTSYKAHLLLIKEDRLKDKDSNRVKVAFQKIEFLLTKYECYWLFGDAMEYINRIKNYLKA